MADRYTSNVKLCVTCSLWGGPREFDTPSRLLVVVEKGSDKGICAGGGLDGFQVAAVQSCDKFQKWPALR